VEGSRDILLEFLDSLHIWDVGRNFTFGTQIRHWGN